MFTVTPPDRMMMWPPIPNPDGGVTRDVTRAEINAAGAPPPAARAVKLPPVVMMIGAEDPLTDAESACTEPPAWISMFPVTLIRIGHAVPAPPPGSSQVIDPPLAIVRSPLTLYVPSAEPSPASKLAKVVGTEIVTLVTALFNLPEIRKTVVPRVTTARTNRHFVPTCFMTTSFLPIE